jgi:hypothetical protein
MADLSGLSALVGAAIGGVTAIASTWLVQHSQARNQRRADMVARRQQFYGNFIDEASKLYIDALCRVSEIAIIPIPTSNGGKLSTLVDDILALCSR